MNLWKNCVDGIWWKCGFTGFVIFLAILAGHFHKKLFTVQKCFHYRNLRLQLHNWFSSVHRALTVKSVQYFNFGMPIDKVSYSANFMTIQRQKDVSLLQNSLLKHDIYISADIWGHQRVDISLRHRNRWHSVYLWRGVSWLPHSCTWCDWWFLLWVRRWRFPVQSAEECVFRKQRLVHHVEKWVYFIDSLFID